LRCLAHCEKKLSAVIPEAAAQASLRSLRKLGCVRLSGIHIAPDCNQVMDSGFAPLARPGMTTEGFSAAD
jgi:hypothetical protein